jgi:hypothetical protein
MHLRRSLCVLTLLSLFALPLRAAEPPKSEPISPKDGPIKLFNGKDLAGLTTWLKDAKYEDPRNVFTVENGMLHISGDGYGYARTNQAYKDYHLIIEFRWDERTWAPRVDKARDSGVIVHCVGPDGGYGNTFMCGHEAQIIEGGVGDFIVVSGKNKDGSPLVCSLTAETTKDRDGETVWKEGGEKKTLQGGRINWYGRDPDWADVRGFRGREDVESPGKKWTRMDVVCDGHRITIQVNGVVVNKGFDAKPSAGLIQVQTEGAELYVRRFEIWPLGKAPAFNAAELQK